MSGMKTIETDRSFAGARLRRGAGFTLIEMLTIITIVALLIGISMPTILSVWMASRAEASRARINLIEGACRMYYNDFEHFPPSSPEGGHLPNWQGRELLPLLLVGYGGDAGVKGRPLDSEKFDTDDGNDGYGFRTTRRGKVYGPYNGVETLETGKTSRGRAVFIDVFEHEIYYYRFDESSGKYNAGDNSDGPGDVNDYAKDNDGKYFRQDFILMTRGADREWKAFRDDMTTDDITNFLEEQ